MVPLLLALAHAETQCPGEAYLYEAGLSIDADGAPNAYGPDGKGSDRLANAGKPGNWWGIVASADGKPHVQGPDDPSPGFYVSTTALQDTSKPVTDPARYVDSTKVPYVVLPKGAAHGASLGDLALVVNGSSRSFAIYADIGPAGHLGEGSIALAEALGVDADARSGGAESGVLYVVFPGSGDGIPLSNADIAAKGEAAFTAWGGQAKLDACAGTATPTTPPTTAGAPR